MNDVFFMKTSSRVFSCFAIFATLLFGSIAGLRAEIPGVLTDKIHRGSGVIDLMKDFSGAQFSEYLKTYGNLYLAADINENASGNETSRSQGVALKEMRLLLSTTDGDFSFGDLQATFWPFSTNGAHLIYAAPKEVMSAEEFLELARSNARKLAELVRSTP